MTMRHETINKGNPFFQFSNLVYANLTLLVHKVGEVGLVVRKRIAPPLGAPLTCPSRTGEACVLHIIRNSGRGVRHASLAEMTGYEVRKLDRILHKLFKRGEIMIEAGGLYAEAKPRSPYGLRIV